MKYVTKTIKSPVGKLKLVASDKGLAAILWENDNPRRVRLGAEVEDPKHPVLLETERQLNDYFAGKLKMFSVPLDTVGTDFQKKVWEALLTIPFGETRSYAQIAKQIGKPKAVRAVGAANGRNPLSIITPCHRVIGSNGKLTGFAGGLETKAVLLRLERTPSQPQNRRRIAIRCRRNGLKENGSVWATVPIRPLGRRVIEPKRLKIARRKWKRANPN